MDRIKQVLMNLISNSLKFTRKGYICVSIGIERQQVQFEAKRFLVVSVKDSGIGIAEEDIPNLFKVFGMVRKNKDEFNMKGTGLGLTI